MGAEFADVTEMPGDEVSPEQLSRMCHRYFWAGRYCADRDVVEAGCGPGQGLGYLALRARSVQAGDFDPHMVERARAHYGDRIPITRFDAQDMPFGDRSLDVVILFEAIYYLPSAEAFVAECSRVLRPGGHVLVCTANRDLYDFTPSPHSVRYLGAAELARLFSERGYDVELFGHLPVSSVSMRQRLLRPLKAIVSRLGLMPRTMAGKRLLKRIFFGSLVAMPAELDESMLEYAAPAPIAGDRPDRTHKVIYCAAQFAQPPGQE